MSGFDAYDSAARMREAIRTIAKAAQSEVYIRPRMATVVSFDFWNQTVELQYPGETDTFTVNFPGAILPIEVGQTVRVNGVTGDRYIDEVFGATQYKTSDGDWVTHVSPAGLATYDSSSFFPNSQWPSDPTTANGAFTTAPFAVRDNTLKVTEGFNDAFVYDYGTEVFVDTGGVDFIIETTLSGVAALRLQEFGVDRVVLPNGAGAGDPEGLVHGDGFRIEMGTTNPVRFTNSGFDKGWIEPDGDAFFGNTRLGDGLSNDSLVLYGFSAPKLAWQKTNGGVVEVASITSSTTSTDLQSDGIFTITIGATLVGTFNTAQLMVGKTSTGLANIGTEMHRSGTFDSTRDDDTAGLRLNKITGFGSGSTFAQFMLNGAAIGSITRNAATSAVLYNVSSDKRLKRILGLVDDDDVLDKFLRFEFVEYEFKSAPGYKFIGHVAQQIATVDDMFVRRGGANEHINPWTIDYGQQSIFTGAALQATIRRMAKIEERLNAAGIK